MLKKGNKSYSGAGLRFLFRQLFCNPYGNAPSVPRTRAAAALHMKQIALDNQSRMIRRLRVQLATERRGLAIIKKEHESTQVALEASHKTIAGLTEIGLCSYPRGRRFSPSATPNIEALVEEKDSLLQTIQGLQEANDAPAPFDDEWEEEPEEDPEEEEIEEIPVGEGDIVDEYNMFYLSKPCIQFILLSKNLLTPSL
ncbi:Isoleucine-tRNA synthetase [Dorcoceras hygrometricum]|uniref:Isoleucine-tRNA synthetase n=1 Tax=Dorcoceras hygrometricum TaxID=472368 RepID=A0A2Z7BB91_9LAMI|nr:Isoleucine-tRNA synthetase [Dorcoceras hygrometricum]